VSTFLLQTDGKNILFDAGLGAFGGQMLNRLTALGIDPDNIQLIYLTHFHVDHIAGLIAQDSTGNATKVFKNAAIYAGKVEYDAWMNNIPKNDLQKTVMGIYKDSLHLFAFGDSLPNGILAIDAVGHTPGHTAFQFSNLLVVGDLMHGYALQKDHPEINSNYDMDKEKSIESRKRIMQYARDKKLLMAGMHLPPPGFAK
jgi:glyoxylase-like metal-dependent hydrolase (beta-lactamase superfamily II)